MRLLSNDIAALNCPTPMAAQIKIIGRELKKYRLFVSHIIRNANTPKTVRYGTRFLCNYFLFTKTYPYEPKSISSITAMCMLVQKCEYLL